MNTTNTVTGVDESGGWNWDSVYPAPAKINLFLHVVGRRDDGYHLLQTVFRFLDRSDGLRFAPRRDGAVRRASVLPGVAEEQDLTVRAARLLQEAAGCRQGADIHVDKLLPMGGGLGGGSSDAATTLVALNHLWGLGLSRRALMALGLRLGADVPVFVFGHSAFAEGVGEALQAVDPAPAWYVVAEPGVAVPTAEIFSDPDLTRDSKMIKIADFLAGAGALVRPGMFGRNDLEPVAARRYPQVARCLEWLSRFGEARMSGSGACVFSAFSDEVRARAVCEALQGEVEKDPSAQGFKVWMARGMDVHPLSRLVR